MIINKLIQDVGVNWVQSNKADNSWSSFCVTPTRKIFATSNTGIWYSDDDGVNWTNLSPVSYRFLGITPTGRIFATNASGYGLYYSDDNCVSWTNSNISTTFAVNSLCITSTGRVIIGLVNITNDTSIWYSDDNGVNWVQSNTRTIIQVSALCITPTGRIIAGTRYGSGLYAGIWYSDDNGVSWAQSNASGLNCGFVQLCVTKTGRIIANSIKVNGGSSSGNPGIWYSDDNGVNWTQSNITDDINGPLCVMPTGRILTSLSGANSLSMIGVYCSDDNGVNWTRPSYTKILLRSSGPLCITPTGRILATHIDGGIWYSDPGTQRQYNSKPLTGKQAKELVQQCKAYVQSLKNGN